MQVHAELILEVPVEHGLLLENLLDLAHAPFTHTSTFAKGWPIPDVVKFNAQKLLGGNWEPYPIDMAFEPPCMVLSTIGVHPFQVSFPLSSAGNISNGAASGVSLVGRIREILLRLWKARVALAPLVLQQMLLMCWMQHSKGQKHAKGRLSLGQHSVITYHQPAIESSRAVVHPQSRNTTRAQHCPSLVRVRRCARSRAAAAKADRAGHPAELHKVVHGLSEVV